MTKRIFIGVAWPYVNGDLHVGHLAGYLIPADIFSRYCRLRGYETLMVSGTDCHGTPITVEADKRKISPQELVNEYTPKIKRLIEIYGATYDIFTSTTTENHKKIVQDFFLNLLKNGYILKQKTLQYYSQQEKKFLPDRYVEGECFYCHAKDQRSDQCENCGRTLSPGELINPRSKLTGLPVILKETEHYFLDYSKLQKEIENFVLPSTHWREWVYNETIGFLKEGLKPRAITRDLDWGIPLPKEKIPSEFIIENIDHKRFYVWFEAVIGYFSATVEWSEKNNKNYEDFWLDPKTKHYYFMGKDNLTYHTIFWPGQLIGQKKGYNLPYFPAINHFLLLEGQKFSKSRGIHLDSLEVAQIYGVDNVRFYIASILPENKDSNWQFNEFKNIINNILVDKIGNFFQRVLIFYKDKLNGNLTNPQLDKEVLFETQKIFKEVSEDLDKVEILNAFSKILNYVHFANNYLEKNKPWDLIKIDKEAANNVIYSSLQIVNSLKTLLWPFIPHSIEKLSEIINSKIEIKIGNDNFQFQEQKNFKVSDIQPLFKKLT
jgi:methionyl-tRNA synthetase